MTCRSTFLFFLKNYIEHIINYTISQKKSIYDNDDKAFNGRLFINNTVFINNQQFFMSQATQIETSLL